MKMHRLERPDEAVCAADDSYVFELAKADRGPGAREASAEIRHERGSELSRSFASPVQCGIHFETRHRRTRTRRNDVVARTLVEAEIVPEKKLSALHQEADELSKSSYPRFAPPRHGIALQSSLRHSDFRIPTWPCRTANHASTVRIADDHRRSQPRLGIPARTSPHDFREQANRAPVPGSRSILTVRYEDYVATAREAVRHRRLRRQGEAQRHLGR